MKYIIKNNNKPLKGTIKISGAKNSALGIIAATLLNEEPLEIKNIPNITDITNLLETIELIGGKVNFKDNTLIIDNSDVISDSIIDYDCIRKIRASYYLLGALLGRFKKAIVAMPGGCKIGTRPIDLHLKGFEALGATTKLEDGNIIVEANTLIGNTIFLDFPSVGATINIMLAAIYAEGTTIIKNAAKEPHVIDIANFLIECGAIIYGAGTNEIKIEGCKTLHKTTYTVIPDQIEAGTFMVAATMTNGDIYIDNIIPNHLRCIALKLEEMGAIIEYEETKLHIKGPKEINPTDIQTSAYPGFPTDLQPIIAVALGLAKGNSLIEETIFDNRYIYVGELARMGSKMKVSGNVNIIQGIPRYKGAIVNAPDLRGGAALVLAGLTTSRTTTIRDIEYIERGYENFDEKLRILGVDIKKI